MLGAWEIVVVFLVILLLFGGKKLPELARSLGQGIREFKKASHEISGEIEKEAPPVKPEASKEKSPPQDIEDALMAEPEKETTA